VKAYLGINTGFALNRFPQPESWCRIIGEELGLRRVQLTADVFGAHHSEELQEETLRRIQTEAERYGLWVHTTFTGAFTRVNHLMHPDEGVRLYWFEWLKRFFSASARLGAVGAGSHAGILASDDEGDEETRARRVADAARLWQDLCDYASGLGMEFLMFEPMSIPRELGETIEKARGFRSLVQNGTALPFLYCLDVDHGDLASPDPRDTDPYAWLVELGAASPVVHIKQSLLDKGGHHPFTSEYNRRGKITPERVLDALERSGAKEVTLLLEISHRERMPYDGMVLKDLKESVEYWRPHVSAG